MPTIKFFIISCSSDGLPEPLFIWGEGADHSMPTTLEEAETRIANCREQIGCKVCDAQIHHLRLVRTHKSGAPYSDEMYHKITS